jgi:patatin-like phospholipase/acyl hydrolase
MLDGGGVRGMFMYHILRRIRQSRFDLIVGVSVGAVIGALFASGKIQTVTADCIIQEYIPHMFQCRTRMGPWFTSKYTGEGKREMLKRMFGTLKMKDLTINMAILTSTVDGRERMIRSYDAKDGHILVVDALDASSAAPSYFPPVNIPGIGWLIDGGILENTPIINTYNEIMELFQDAKVKLLCISTSNQQYTRDIIIGSTDKMGILAWYMNGMMDMLMGTNSTARQQLIERLLGNGNYMRIYPCRNYDMDDTSMETLHAIQCDADNTWNVKGCQILSFL